MYTVIIRNNATNDYRIYGGLVNVSTSKLYLQFNEFETDLPDGEYTYCVFINDRNDVQIDVQPEISKTIVTADGKEVEVRYLHPRIGLLRIGETPKNEDEHYENKSNDIYYYE